MFWLGNFYLYSFQASAVDIFLIKKNGFAFDQASFKLHRHEKETQLGNPGICPGKSSELGANTYYQSLFSVNIVLSTSHVPAHASSC